MPEINLIQVSREYLEVYAAECQASEARQRKLTEYLDQLQAIENPRVLASYAFRHVGMWDERHKTLTHKMDIGHRAKVEEAPVLIRYVGETAVTLSAAYEDGTGGLSSGFEVKYQDFQIHGLL